MNRWWTTYYVDARRVRHDELNLSLRVNADCFDQVHVVCDACQLKWSQANVEQIVVTERPTVGAVLKLAQDCHAHDLVVVGNCDIIVPPDALRQMQAVRPGECYALARWEPWGLFDVNYSNDLWVFRGPPPLIEADYWWGVPGVDNRLCHDLAEAGYAVTNPSRTIRTYHLHGSRQRTETNKKAHRVPPPYLFIEPTELARETIA